jgi:hypothetical protein
MGVRTLAILTNICLSTWLAASDESGRETNMNIVKLRGSHARGQELSEDYRAEF